MGRRAPFRFSRALAVTTASFGLAAGAHTLAGGTLPAPEILVGLLALALAPVMILARAKITAPGMLVLLGAGQLALHQAFDAFTVSAAFIPAASEHLHGQAVAGTLTAGPLMTGHTAAPGALMVALHALATLATALLLARGEAAVWALAAWLRPLVHLPAALEIPVLPPAPAPPVVFVPSRWRSLRLPARRGPPSFFHAL